MGLLKTRQPRQPDNSPSGMFPHLMATTVWGCWAVGAVHPELLEKAFERRDA